MSLLRSWLQKPTQPSSPWSPHSTPSHQNHDHQQELDDMDNTITTATTFSPRRSSPHTPTTPRNSRRPNPQTTLHALARKEAQLQAQLQALLDDQADGLIAGLANPSSSSPSHSQSRSQSRSHSQSQSQSQSQTRTTTRSGTPTTPRSPSSQPPPPTLRAIPVRQPPAPGPPSLRATRRGILQAMAALSAVKADEAAELAAQAAGNDAAAARARRWAEKRAGLREAVARLEGGGEGERGAALAEEEAALEREMQGLQRRLEELRERRRAVRRESEGLQNRLLSRLSSYKASLEIVESDVRRFLEAPVVPGVDGRGVEDAGEEGYLALVPGRRTLELALEYMEGQGERLGAARERVEEEVEALDEGVVVWKDVVDEVNAAERHLRREMQKLASSTASTLIPARGRAGFEKQESSDLDGIIARMDETIANVESKMKLAEARGWNLLVCCIGAELEAFRQGRQLLLDATGGVNTNDSKYGDQGDKPTENGQDGGRVDEYSPGGSPVTRRGPFASRGRAQASDDEPDPDLLVSHHDTDTESSV